MRISRYFIFIFLWASDDENKKYHSSILKKTKQKVQCSKEKRNHTWASNDENKKCYSPILKKTKKQFKKNVRFAEEDGTHSSGQTSEDFLEYRGAIKIAIFFLLCIIILYFSKDNKKDSDFQSSTP